MENRKQNELRFNNQSNPQTPRGPSRRVLHRQPPAQINSSGSNLSIDSTRTSIQVRYPGNDLATLAGTSRLSPTPDLGSSEYLPQRGDQVSSSVGHDGGGNDSLLPGSAIPTSRAEDDPSACSFFEDTIPDSYQNTNHPASSSAFSLPQSSPPLLHRVLSIPSTRFSSSLLTSPSGKTSSTPVVIPCNSTTRSFIHYHGTTAGIGAARRWTCTYFMTKGFE
ncbi:hypothetical protein HOY82DRAFT_538025 [Tuber indicum]|nr:hypothetical protein HOY82DRAFT_538025 [Tuber indicum]